jgi:hypothetical protein
VREKPTVGSPFFGACALTASLRRRRMSTYFCLFRVAIPLNYTREFSEILKLLCIISEGKFIPVHAMKAKAEAEEQLCSFLNSAVDGSDRSTSRKRLLYPRRKGSRCLQNRRLGGPHSRSRSFREQKDPLSLPAVRNTSFLFSSPQRGHQMIGPSRCNTLGSSMNNKLVTTGKEEAIVSCEMLFGHLTVGTEKKHELLQNIRYPNQDLNLEHLPNRS